jgi:hypothetical protein
MVYIPIWLTANRDYFNHIDIAKIQETIKAIWAIFLYCSPQFLIILAI